MSDMRHIDSESASDVMRWLQDEATVLWPAFLGSLSLRRSRCVRPNCAACLSGEQHRSYVLYVGVVGWWGGGGWCPAAGRGAGVGVGRRCCVVGWAGRGGAWVFFVFFT